MTISLPNTTHTFPINVALVQGRGHARQTQANKEARAFCSLHIRASLWASKTNGACVWWSGLKVAKRQRSLDTGLL